MVSNKFYKIYELSQGMQDEDCSYVVPLTHVRLHDTVNGVVVERVVVSLRNLLSQPVDIEVNVDGDVFQHTLFKDLRLADVGMRDPGTCFVKAPRGSILVECSYDRQLLPVEICSVMAKVLPLELDSSRMTLRGVNISTTGSEFIFVPCFVCKAYYTVRPTDFTQVFRWDGENYRMLDRKGKFIDSDLQHTDAVTVCKIILLRSRPRWFYSPEVM